MSLRDWRDGVMLGAALGLVVLGVGGRIAMRVFVLLNDLEPAFTVRGSATVVAAGMLTGAADAAIFLSSRSLFASRPRLREFVFWGASAVLAVGILWPVTSLRLELFLPLAALFGGSLRLVWSRRHAGRQHRQEPGPGLTPVR